MYMYACNIYLYMHPVMNRCICTMEKELSSAQTNEVRSNSQQQQQPSSRERGWIPFLSPMHLRRSTIRNRNVHVSRKGATLLHVHQRMTSLPFHLHQNDTSEAHRHLALRTSTSVSRCSVSYEQLCNDWFRRMVM